MKRLPCPPIGATILRLYLLKYLDFEISVALATRRLSPAAWTRASHFTRG